jgi:hypothetical protein
MMKVMATQSIQTFSEIWKKSAALGIEVTGVVVREGHGVVTRDGSSHRVANDYIHPNTFHTHIVSETEEKVDPPSSQDFIMVIDRAMNMGVAVSDTVISETGCWKIEVSPAFTQNPVWIENVDKCIDYTRGYFHWLNLMLASGYLDERQYLSMVDVFDPCKLSDLAARFIDDEGEDGVLYVYSDTELLHGTGNYPCAEELKQFYAQLKSDALSSTMYEHVNP